MIYAYNKKVSSKQESYIFPDQKEYEVKKLLYRLEDRDVRQWKICIPRDYARMESNKKIYHVEEVENIPHYEIYLVEQQSDSKFLENNLVYFKLPNSDRFYTLLIHDDYNVSFVKHEHKFILRDSDELDRRIILGFCKMYAARIGFICQNMHGLSAKDELPWLKEEAIKYRASMQPKRIKAGCYSRPNMRIHGENSIFTNVAII